jgi:hypothetical protein
VLRLDVGAGMPVECFVYRDRLDPAASLASFSEATFASIAQHMEVKARRVDRVDAGSFGASPYLAIDWLYRIEVDGNGRVGEVKHLVATRAARSVYCQHHEVGYAGTFQRVARALVESLEYQEPASPEPYFSEVLTLAIGGMRVGIEHTTLTRDSDGDTRVDTFSSLVVPVDGETLQVSDTFGVEFARPDGSLINQVHVEAANGELVTQLHLDPKEGGLWAVSGTFQTKPLSAEIRAKTAPVSWLGEAMSLREALAVTGVGATLTLERWVPDADPTRLIEETLSIQRQVDRDRFGAKLVMAAIEADLVVDRAGLVTSGSMELGRADVRVERVYVGGEI